jgi:hypothetical protein
MTEQTLKLDNGRVITTINDVIVWGLSEKDAAARDSIDMLVFSDLTGNEPRTKIDTLSDVHKKYGDVYIEYVEGVLAGIAIAEAMYDMIKMARPGLI